VPIRRVLTSLPYVRLIAANLVVALVVGLGLVLFVVPGVAAMTLLGIVGPLVNIERLSVREALRRSVRLVRPRFWLAFVSITVPVLAEEALEHPVTSALWNESFLVGFLVNVGFALAVGATVGLLEVTLAHDLIARDRMERQGSLIFERADRRS
jgi:hypothetical protein